MMIALLAMFLTEKVALHALISGLLATQKEFTCGSGKELEATETC
jgi:hypothetical protein